MKILKKKISAIALVIFFVLSMSASLTLIPSSNAHTPSWNIPTYAYINAAPNPVGVGQTLLVYMWLDAVYGAAGGTSATVGTNGYTASAALLANNYRFHNYQLTITAPDGTVSTQTFAIVSDTTSSQYYSFTPNQVGTYTLKFTYPGQVYGANGNGYSGSPLINDTYLPSSASTSLTVQQAAIPGPTTSEPLPANYWQEPIYGENTNWYSISSNWLGQAPSFFGAGAPIPAGYTSSSLYHGDAVGPLSGHIMWTSQLWTEELSEGNLIPSVPGVGYYEGSSYQPRFTNPIIMDGLLYYTETVSFTGSNSFSGGAVGPTDYVNLRTGQILWSRTDVPQPSFGYIYYVYDPDQHGVFPPILVSVSGGFNFFAPQLSTPTLWQLFDGYTGDSPLQRNQHSIGTAVAGPSGEQLQYVFNNVGSPFAPNWYLDQWNSSKLWLYDINPYTGGGSMSPSIINASNGALVSTIPIPRAGESGTLPNGFGISVPYGSALTVDA